jgi:hypothetical protein
MSVKTEVAAWGACVLIAPPLRSFGRPAELGAVDWLITMAALTSWLGGGTSAHTVVMTGEVGAAENRHPIMRLLSCWSSQPAPGPASQHVR